MQPNEMLLTRKQLQGFGLSRYQAANLTKGIPVVEKQGSTNCYRLPEVLTAAREYLAKRIKDQTRKVVLELIEQLQAMIGNVVRPNFGQCDNPRIRRSLNRLKGAIADSNRASAQLRAFVAEVGGKYEVKS